MSLSREGMAVAAHLDERPEDLTARMALADAFEESGDEERAHFTRWLAGLGFYPEWPMGLESPSWDWYGGPSPRPPYELGRICEQRLEGSELAIHGDVTGRRTLFSHFRTRADAEEALFLVVRSLGYQHPLVRALEEAKHGKEEEV